MKSRDNWIKKHQHLMQRMNKEMMKTQQMQTQIAKLKAKNKRLEGTNKILTNELVKMKRKYQNEQNERIEMLTQPQFEQSNMPWNQFRFNCNSKQIDDTEPNISITERIGIPIKTQMFQKIACCNAKVFEFDAYAHSVYYSHSQHFQFYDINTSSLANGSLTNYYGSIKKVHSQTINDIKFRHRTQSELLSVSDDATMAISDIRSNQRKYYYTLPDRANCCLWSKNYEHCMYAVCSDGSINILDIRRNHQKNYCLYLNQQRMPLKSIQYCASNKLLISSKYEVFVLREDDFKHFIKAKNIKCKPLISCPSFDNERIIYSSHYDEQSDSLLLSYKNKHCIVQMDDINSKITIEYDGPSTSRMSLFCMGGSNNKYICYSDSKQKLNLVSSNFNNNNDYRFKDILHDFGKSVCCNIKTFDSKIIGALCNDYLLFYKCSM